MNIDGRFNGPFNSDDICRTEWLETNAAGAFASSTVTEKNIRKYHGLLVTPLAGHEGRFHILSSVDAVFNFEVPLSAGSNRYPDAVHPDGAGNIEQVELIPLQRWVYGCGENRISKELMMIDGQPAVYLAYTLLGGASEITADLKFMFTCRNAHSLTAENPAINRRIETSGDCCSIEPYPGLPRIKMTFSGEWSQSGGIYWDRSICYETEKERGLDWMEDRFVPGNIGIRLKSGQPFIIKIGVDDGVIESGAEVKDAFEAGKESRVSGYREPRTGIELLKRQAVHFFLKNPSGKKSINAGYPWFGEWGRDTMIALPGLTFSCGKTAEGAGILTDYVSMIRDGLLPNTLGGTQGFTSYNSIDAGLLFCRAVRIMLDSGYGGLPEEQTRIDEVFEPAVRHIVGAFIENRVPETRLDENGLIWTGNPGTQLTWMDATAWGKPVTPRYGYAVELNSLWYDALCLLRVLGRSCSRKLSPEAVSLLDRIPESYIKTFWLDEGYLSDTVNEHGPDRKIRPNMLFATASGNGLLCIERMRSVVAVAERELLTPLGMRTLSPEDPDFRAEYSGSPDERDSRYHQGTVWPWPLGIMIESSLNAAEDIEQISVFWSDYIDNLLSMHLCRDGWGSISEVFDGLTPSAGKGCFAQAWSCGEIIRASELVERVMKDE